MENFTQALQSSNWMSFWRQTWSTFDNKPSENASEVVHSYYDDFTARLLGGLLVPSVMGLTSMVVFTVLFEWILRQPWAKKYHIVYRDGRSRYDENRRPLPETMQQNERFDETVINFVTNTIAGPFGLYLLGPKHFNMNDMIADYNNLSMLTFWIKVIGYLVYHDFVFYCMHYTAHTNDFLWKHIHADHHAIRVPTATTTLAGGYLDSLIFGSAPHLVTILTLQPPALVAYTGVTLYTCVSIYNHSGLNIPRFNRFMLGWVPGRANSRLHDSHHKHSGRKRTDLGLLLWVWDYIFGTLSDHYAELSPKQA